MPPRIRWWLFCRAPGGRDFRGLSAFVAAVVYRYSMTTSHDVRPYETVDIAEAGENDRSFFSVTSVLKALQNGALEYWAIKQTAMAAIDSQATWNAMLQDQGRFETIKWLCGARFRRPKLELGADQLGTVVHKVCETYALTGKKPEREYCADLVRAHAAPTVELDQEVVVVGQMLNQFQGWVERFQPDYTDGAAEMAVYNEQFGYAGSLDAIFSLDGTPLIVDFKTRREPLTAQGKEQTPYGETALQLSAYRHAEIAAAWRARRVEKYKRRYYLLNDTEKSLSEQMPKVDGGLCIIITPQSCEAYPVKCDQSVFDSFLYTFEAFRWLEDISKRVIGEALVETPRDPHYADPRTLTEDELVRFQKRNK